jgi:hypothetical protein
MRNVVLKSIEEVVFRANPTYEVVLFDRLPSEQTDMLSDLRKDPNLYGILRPREHPELGIKSVDRDTALLYFTLKEPGRLPAYIKPMLGDQCNQAIVELVLDGVLEIESHGKFVSGADASRLVYGEELRPVAPGNPCPAIDCSLEVRASSSDKRQHKALGTHVFLQSPARFPRVEAETSHTRCCC